MISVTGRPTKAGTWDLSAEIFEDLDKSICSAVEEKEVTGGTSVENEEKENRV